MRIWGTYKYQKNQQKSSNLQSVVLAATILTVWFCRGPWCEQFHATMTMGHKGLCPAEQSQKLVSWTHQWQFRPKVYHSRWGLGLRPRFCHNILLLYADFLPLLGERKAALILQLKVPLMSSEVWLCQISAALERMGKRYPPACYFVTVISSNGHMRTQLECVCSLVFCPCLYITLSIPEKEKMTLLSKNHFILLCWCFIIWYSKAMQKD